MIQIRKRSSKLLKLSLLTSACFVSFAFSLHANAAPAEYYDYPGRGDEVNSRNSGSPYGAVNSGQNKSELTRNVSHQNDESSGTSTLDLPEIKSSDVPPQDSVAIRKPIPTSTVVEEKEPIIELPDMGKKDDHIATISTVSNSKSAPSSSNSIALSPATPKTLILLPDAHPNSVEPTTSDSHDSLPFKYSQPTKQSDGSDSLAPKKSVSVTSNTPSSSTAQKNTPIVTSVPAPVLAPMQPPAEVKKDLPALPVTPTLAAPLPSITSAPAPTVPTPPVVTPVANAMPSQPATPQPPAEVKKDLPALPVTPASAAPLPSITSAPAPTAPTPPVVTPVANAMPSQPATPQLSAEVKKDLPALPGTPAPAAPLENTNAVPSQPATPSIPPITSAPAVATNNSATTSNTNSPAPMPKPKAIKKKKAKPSTPLHIDIPGTTNVPAPNVDGYVNPLPGQDTTQKKVLSEESKDIIEGLPGDKPIKSETPPPAEIEHSRKTSLERDPNDKKREGPGINIDVKQPKLDISQALENAYYALISGNQEEAVDTYKHVLEVQPNNKGALFGLATTYHRAGQLQLARPLYGKLLSIDPKNIEGLNNFIVLISDESPDEALSELSKLEISHPAFSPVPAQMAAIFDKKGEPQKAIQKMLRAIDLSPENMKYRYNMAILFDKAGDWENATTYYQQLLDASERGEKLSANPSQIQQRLTFIRSNKPKVH